jgi:hypothetical protein
MLKNHRIAEALEKAKIIVDQRKANIIQSVELVR